MNRIDRLIAELCPNGVEYSAIGDIAELVRGNGMPKSDFSDSGVGCIHYGQIYTRYGVWASETLSFISPKKAEKLARVDPGDLIITNTSENLEDVCTAVAWLGDSQIVTGGHATVIKHQQNPKYLSYYFRTPEFFLEKKIRATGTKVIDVSAKSLARIEIPIPPLEVQQEIARILDNFTELEAVLEAELEAELEARKTQLEFYQDVLLDFQGSDVLWTTLGEVATIGTGSRNTNEAVEGGRYPFFVRSQIPRTIDEFEFDEAAIITAGDGVGVGRVFHFFEGRYALHQRAYRIQPASELLIPKYLFYYIRNSFPRYLERASVHSSVTSLRKPMFEQFRIPIPNMQAQERIVSILDSYEVLVSDLGGGLPAEIAARRKQYEHYRDRLLTFKEKAS